ILDVAGGRVVMSANQRYVAVAKARDSDAHEEPIPGDLSIYDTTTGALIRKVDHELSLRRRDFRISSDGRHFGEGYDVLRVLDVTSGRWRTFLPRQAIMHSRESISAPYFTSDGKLVCAWQMGIATVVDLARGTPAQSAA